MGIRSSVLASLMLGVVVLGSGCATKKYVSQSVEPMKLRVDSLDEKSQKQGEAIDQLNKDVDTAETEISGAKERLGTVEGRVGDAFTKIGQNETGLNELRSRIANLDDFKQAQQSTVLFAFDKDALTPETTAMLDQMAAAVAGQKRYFITVEGFTDQIGPEDYNFQLSRRRADRVVRYLVAQHNIPVQRIFVIGLGEQRLVETTTDRDARARNRRVEVVLFSAESAPVTASRD